MSDDRPVLHFVHGKPGAGKTTLARRLAASLRAILFCEDEWLAAIIDAPVVDLQDYLRCAAKVRRLVAPLATDILRHGLPVVLDFGGNTARDRRWVRSIFEAAGAAHTLHLLDVPDAECKARIAARNLTKPEGLYFGPVSESLFDEVIQHITPPAEEEGFVLRRW